MNASDGNRVKYLSKWPEDLVRSLGVVMEVEIRMYDLVLDGHFRKTQYHLTWSQIMPTTLVSKSRSMTVLMTLWLPSKGTMQNWYVIRPAAECC